MKSQGHRGNSLGNGKSWYVKDSNRRNQVKYDKENPHIVLNFKVNFSMTITLVVPLIYCPGEKWRKFPFLRTLPI